MYVNMQLGVMRHEQNLTSTLAMTISYKAIVMPVLASENKNKNH